MNLFENLQLMNETNETSVDNLSKMMYYEIRPLLKRKYNFLRDLDITNNNKLFIVAKVHPKYYRIRQCDFIDDIHDSYDNLSKEELLSALEDVINLYAEKRNEYFTLLQQLPKINIIIGENTYRTSAYSYMYGEFAIEIKSKINSAHYAVCILNVYNKSKIKISDIKDCEYANIEKVKAVIQRINDKKVFSDIVELSEFLKNDNAEIYEL